jgi:uncharacterized protein (DUF983 family)
MTRIRIDLFKKIGWPAYLIAVVIVVAVVGLAWKLEGATETPPWVEAVLAPILGWTLIALSVVAALGLILRKRK